MSCWPSTWALCPLSLWSSRHATWLGNSGNQLEYPCFRGLGCYPSVILGFFLSSWPYFNWTEQAWVHYLADSAVLANQIVFLPAREIQSLFSKDDDNLSGAIETYGTDGLQGDANNTLRCCVQLELWYLLCPCTCIHIASSPLWVPWQPEVSVAKAFLWLSHEKKVVWTGTTWN